MLISDSEVLKGNAIFSVVTGVEFLSETGGIHSILEILTFILIGFVDAYEVDYDFLKKYI